MTKYLIATIAVLFTSLVPTYAKGEFYEICPVSAGSDRTLGPPFPESENWYGSEALAVILPNDGIWGVTGPTARIAVKLFIWSVGFEPGMESNLAVKIENLNRQPNDALVKGVTNAKAESLGGWTMLAGLDFPSSGCWRITAAYLGQSLSFVVETVDRGE